MTAWTSDELNKIGTAEELEITPTREDGSLRKPTTIWVVRVADDLYVRSWRGHSGAWFGAAKANQEGRIQAGGVEKNVSFEDGSDIELNNQVDDAYHAKYDRYPQYVRQMVAPEQRSTTIRLVPKAAPDSG
jgi:hypothetical protein